PRPAAARLLLDRTVRRQVHSAADGDDDRGHRQRRKDDEAQLVDRVLNANTLEPISETRPEELSRPVSGDTAEQLTQMMTGVVDNGTGSVAKINGMKVAAKTGTAQHAEGAAPH